MADRDVRPETKPAANLESTEIEPNSAVKKAKKRRGRRGFLAGRLRSDSPPLLLTGFVLDDDHGADPTTDREVTFDAEPTRLDGGDDVVSDLVGDLFMKGPFVAE